MIFFPRRPDSPNQNVYEPVPGSLQSSHMPDEKEVQYDYADMVRVTGRVTAEVSIDEMEDNKAYVSSKLEDNSKLVTSETMAENPLYGSN